MTLLFHYPTAFEYSKYLRPQIKIEFGRGDQQPSGKSAVTPFVAEVFPDIFREKSATTIVLGAERTFVELKDRYFQAVADYFRRRATLERVIGAPIESMIPDHQ